MAVMKMDVVSIIGNMAVLNDVTAICGRSGVFHPDNPMSFYSDTSILTTLHEENPYSEPLQRLEDAGKSMGYELKWAPGAADESIQEEDARTYVDYFAMSLRDLNSVSIEAQRNIAEFERSFEQVSHFVGLDLNLDEIRKCEFIKVRFGSIPKESLLKINAYDGNPYIIFFPCSSDAMRYWGVYFTPIEVASEVDRIFASLYFERTMLPQLHGTPESYADDLRESAARERKKMESAQKRISAFWEKEREECERIYSWLKEKDTFFAIRRSAAKYNEVFILTGWIPAEESTSFERSLSGIDTVECTFEDARTELAHSPPVKLKNKGFFKFFEFFVDLYGLPNYDEVDPTAFVAITYILLFGIMFADLGHGIILAIAGYLMWRVKKMPLGKALIPCGVSSVLFGVLFGSCFGFETWLNPFYRAVFGLKEKPINVMEPQTTNYIIYFAVGLGIVLILTAMLINIVVSLKRKRYEDGLFGPNGLAGFVFYAALLGGFGTQLITGIQVVTLPYVLCLIVLPLLVIFFREVLGGLVERRPDAIPKKWGEFIVQNFFELFELMLSYAGNTISFLRVGAYVLVHAGMMLVVFTLAEMSSGIGYILIVAIGNLFVIGLEGLLVGIQVLRLEFYEMFSRFFDGGGRPFTPVKTS